MQICRHCFISGRVQGVSFRYYTAQEAKKYGLTGWVRNLQDGRVEVFFCGEEQTVDNLYQWLYQGPTLAKVVEVECHSVEATEKIPDFQIR